MARVVAILDEYLIRRLVRRVGTGISRIRLAVLVARPRTPIARP
jgi:hypothetical protein